jgi:hypothetical protein
MSFIVRRLIFYLVAAWVALTINFFIPRLMPGNAVESIMAKFPNLQPSAYRAIEAAPSTMTNNAVAFSVAAEPSALVKKPSLSPTRAEACVMFVRKPSETVTGASSEVPPLSAGS